MPRYLLHTLAESEQHRLVREHVYQARYAAARSILLLTGPCAVRVAANTLFIGACRFCDKKLMPTRWNGMTKCIVVAVGSKILPPIICGRIGIALPS